jgi:hypothetical protein
LDSGSEAIKITYNQLISTHLASSGSNAAEMGPGQNLLWQRSSPNVWTIQGIFGQNTDTKNRFISLQFKHFFKTAFENF